MPEYKLIVNEDGAIILDQDGEAVDHSTALTLIDLLSERYEPPACVYVVHSAAMNAYKIGWTAQRIGQRVAQIRYDVRDWQGVDLVLTVECLSVSNARTLEARLHEDFADKNIYGEWFHLSEDDLIYLMDFRQSEATAILNRFLKTVGRLMESIDMLSDDQRQALIRKLQETIELLEV